MDAFRDSKGRIKKGARIPDAIRKKISETTKGIRRTKWIDCICEVCNKAFEVPQWRKSYRFCSRECNAKGVGKYISKGVSTGLPNLSTQGYWFLHYPLHPRANKQGRVKLSDLIYEKYHRPLQENEIVHHKDKCKTNDHPDNLEAMDKREHERMHLKERWMSGEMQKHRSKL